MTASEVQQIIERINRMAEENSKRFTHIENMITGDSGDNGIKAATVRNTEHLKSIQNEVTEHKKNHWATVALTITGAGVLVTLITRLLG